MVVSQCQGYYISLQWIAFVANKKGFTLSQCAFFYTADVIAILVYFESYSQKDSNCLIKGDN